MPTTAFIPALNILPLTASVGLALPTKSIKAATDIIIISMVWLIVTPSGRNLGKKPKTITNKTPAKKAQTEYFARGLDSSSAFSKFRLSSSGLIIPSATLRLYSGSSSNSLPMWF